MIIHSLEPRNKILGILEILGNFLFVVDTRYIFPFFPQKSMLEHCYIRIYSSVVFYLNLPDLR